MLGPMGRNAGLLVVLLILLGGVFAWLLGDPGDPVNAGPGGSGSSDVTIAERLDLTAPDELHASDPGEDEPGGREAIAIEPSPDDLLADLLALDRSRVVGRLLDPDGRPLAGHTVHLAVVGERTADLVRARRRGVVRVELEAVTNGMGRFAFEPSPVTGAWHVLRAEHASWPPVQVGPVGPVPGRETEVGDLRFGRGATLPLRVTDDEGLALGGAEVLLARLPAAGTPTATVVGTTRGDGTCLVPDLAPGRYAVGARGPRHALAWSEELELEADVPPAEVTLALRAGHDLYGRVVEEGTGAGVAGAEVLIADRDMRPTVHEVLTTDGQGRFVRPSSFPRQRLRYQVRAEGFFTDWGTLREDTVTAGQLEQVITLQRVSTVQVRVLDADTEAPIEGARLYLLGTDSSKTSSAERLGLMARPGANPADAPDLARTDAGGLAEVPAPSNDRILCAAAEGYLAGTVDLPRDRGSLDGTPLEVRLERGGGITVTVSDAVGPLPGARVELCLVTTNPDEGAEASGSRRGWRRQSGISPTELVWSDLARLLPVARKASDAEGTAHFTPVPRGFFRVVASAPGLARMVSEPLRLYGKEERLEVALELAADARVDGRVLLRGEPAPGQRVLAMRELRANENGRGSLPAEAEVHVTHADDEGGFELTGLGPGTWRIFALRPGDIRGAAANGYRAVTRQHDDKAEVLDVVAGGRHRIDLEAQGPGAVLTGRVELNHRPKGGLRVRARMRDPDGGRGPSVTGYTDSAGRYRLEGLLEGDWDLSVSTEPERSSRMYIDRVPLTDELVVVGDVETLERDLSVEVGALTLHATAPELPPDAKGRPQKVSWVSLQLSADQDRGGVAALQGGGQVRGWFPAGVDCELPEVPVGSYVARIAENHVETVRQPVDVDAGLGTRLEIELVAKEQDEE